MILSLFDCLWTILGLNIFFWWDVPIITRCSTNNCGEKWSCPYLIAVICLLRNCKFCKLSCLLSSEFNQLWRTALPSMVYAVPCCMYLFIYCSWAESPVKIPKRTKNYNKIAISELPMNLCCFSVLIITWTCLTWPRWSFFFWKTSRSTALSFKEGEAGIVCYSDDIT